MAIFKRSRSPFDGASAGVHRNAVAFVAFLVCCMWAGATESSLIDLSSVARPSALHASGDTSVNAMNDGFKPADSSDAEHGTYGNWPQTDTQWVEYEWSKAISTRQIDVYWWVDGRGIGAPKACRVLYWDGSKYLPVNHPVGLGVARDQFNGTTFDEITTTRLRLEIVSDGKLSTGILEWRVYDSGKSPGFPPVTVAGVDRVVTLGGKTYLSGHVKLLRPAGSGSQLTWSKESGPGIVTFADPKAAETTATFSEKGEYLLKFSASEGDLSGSSTVHVRVEAPPPQHRLDVVYTTPYSIDSPLWNARAKALIVNWIPHCIAYINRTDIKEGAGGIDNFVEAAKAFKGEPHAGHKGYVFSNAWVHQTVESMCLALMVDPQGDPEIIKAQELMKATLEDWIPKILAAQEPDGYLQTAYTLADRRRWKEKWSPEHREDHEGYVGGYFIESAINHYTLTGGKDRRLYDAAKKLADCWVTNIGPGKKEWFDGHQQMEQALVRFGRFVNDMEGPDSHGGSYIQLAKFLLDSRRGGSEYDQSHLPPGQQYEAVGHAVRATYFYSGMADIAAETADKDYQSAVLSLWDNMVNKKYYVTGGIGSGETSEGFGPNFSLRNHSYCESCSSCGLIFFQYKLNLAYHDAKYADLYEETMYNALLGSTDLPAHHFQYTNPLIDGERTQWHVCPCCVGNIPRTLLMIPTWTYVKDHDGLYVNLFIGSRINVGKVAGTDVEMIQKTDYPWSGGISLTVNPREEKEFSVYVRIPNRKTSELYQSMPLVNDLKSLSLNGESMAPKIENGYAVITRKWKRGDTIQLVLPMAPQRIKADERIEADRGLVALRYGPLIYNVESADQPSLDKALAASPLTAEWHGDLLEGVIAIKGKWADGSPMLAIPNYARMNRLGGNPEKAFGGADSSVNYAPGTAAPEANAPLQETTRPNQRSGPRSIVWMKDE